MMRYIEISPNVFDPWSGEIINDVRYPLNILELWHPDDLDALGLVLPAAADVVPVGKIITGTTVRRVGGVVKWVHDLVDAPAPELAPFPSLTARQVRLGLASIGITDAIVESHLATLLDAEAALIEWRFASSYQREHPLVSILADLFSLPSVQVDDLWMWASAL